MCHLFLFSEWHEFKSNGDFVFEEYATRSKCVEKWPRPTAMSNCHPFQELTKQIKCEVALIGFVIVLIKLNISASGSCSLSNGYRKTCSANVGNNRYDAFRHALWMYLVSDRCSVSQAKALGDAHERGRSLDAPTVMDLYNNNVGRSLYQENSE